MKHSLKLYFAATILASFSSSTAFAADSIGVISDVSGDVVIERSGVFLKAEDGSGLLLGDKVYAYSNSTATLNKGECSASINESSPFTVNKDGECATVLMAQVSQPTPQNRPTPAPVNLPPAPQNNLLYVAGAFAAVGAVVVIAESDGGSDTPSSP